MGFISSVKAHVQMTLQWIWSSMGHQVKHKGMVSMAALVQQKKGDMKGEYWETLNFIKEIKKYL